MQLSNRLTFSLASLVFLIALGLVFAPVSVMAHTATPTGHPHHPAPTVTSVELVDVMTTVSGDQPAASVVNGTFVQLVNDADGDTRTLRVGGSAGEFQVKVTFSEIVYVAINDARLADTALAASGLTVTAAARDDSTKNLFGTTNNDITTENSTRVTTGANANKEFIFTFSVPDAIADKVDDRDVTTLTDNDSIDVWITVNAEAMFNLTGLDAGTNTFGTGNTASTRKKFTIVKNLASADPQGLTAEVRPPLALETTGADKGKAKFQLVFNRALSTDRNNLIVKDDVTIVGGSTTVMPVLSAHVAGVGADAGKFIYTLTVTPADPTGAIAVTLKANSVADGSGKIGPAADVRGIFRPTRDVKLTFGTRKATSLQMCEDDTTTGHNTKLPLAYGPEGSDKITYVLTPALPTGFEWDTTDNQERVIRRTEAKGKRIPAVPGKTTHTWTAITATEEAFVTFTIDVKEHQLPKAPTMVTAIKLKSADTDTFTKNRVQLSWAPPADLTDWVHCIPTPKNYVVYVEAWNDLTGEFAKPSILKLTAVKDKYSSVPIPPATADDNPTASADEDKFTRDGPTLDDTVTNFTAQLPKGIYRFKIAAHNISKLTHNKDKTKDVGLSPLSEDFATWSVLDGEKHIVVADPPNAPEDVEVARYQTNNVTVNWLKVKGTATGGAPVYDDPDSTDPDVMAARKKYYGSYKGHFGGYVVYQIDQRDGTVTRYPEKGKGVLSPKTVAADDRIAPLDADFYGDHPTVNLLNLKPGEYVIRVTASNIAGESLRSVVDNDEHRVIIEATTVLPTFKTKSIDSITANRGTALSATTLPEATLTDNANNSITLYYSLTPALPAGLHFNASTRVLSGTPTAVMASTQYIYSASDNPDPNATGAKTSRLTFNIEVKAMQPQAPDATYANGVTTIGNVTLPAKGFFVVESPAVPDLELFFSQGGSITLMDPAPGTAAAKSVVISEILWGLDYGEPAASQKNKQFIELYNTNISGAVSLTGWTLVFTEGRPAPANDVDQVSNVTGAGWVVNVGQSGRVTGTTLYGGTVPPTELISMYRKIDYAKVQNAADEKRLDGVPGGNAAGGWAASTRVTTQTSIKSSPGRQHFQAFTPITATAVPRSPFVINEIGNDTGGTNDWIELRNVTDSEASLKNHHISVVTGDHDMEYNKDKHKDTQLFHFHDKDLKVPAGGVVLIASTDPINTDIAAGRNLEKSVDDQEPTGLGGDIIYVVRSFNIPDSGKTLLILRKSDKSHEKQHIGTADGIIDVVGTLKVKLTSTGTSLWPLKATGAPHGNVIDGTDDEDFRAGKVYKRNDAGGGTLEKDLAISVYTGIGYDRIAADSAVNGGTPGYDNGALKEKIADSDADVTISEIMLDPGTGRQNLPQWIELYNSSLARAINLNGWKLTIENTTDVDTSLSATITLGGNINIQPNQTVLIVTNSGRTSDPDHFPSNRVINLWTTKAHRDALGISKRTEQVFSATGFYLELTDKDNKLVDEVGNLDGSRRTQDDPAWAVPKSEDSERRSSLIRVYDGGVAEDGMTAAGWMLAETTDLAYAITHTYYGDLDDLGTPGYRGGGPLPVSLSKFRPERLKDTGEIVIRWITESELNNAGFNILRSETRTGEFTKINTSLIKGHGTTSERNTYEWKDTTAKPNVVYYYQIQDVSLDGEVQTLRQSRLKGNVTAAGKLTTTWGELKSQD